MRQYLRLPRFLLAFILAEFFLQVINTGFFHVLLVYMEKQGWTDHQSAGYVSLRFLGVLILAMPLGIYIRRRKLLPLIKLSALTLPVFTLGIVYFIANHNAFWLGVFMTLWGTSFLFMQVCALPFILRNTPVEQHTEGIALSFATFSLGGITSGLLIGGLRQLMPDGFHEGHILAGIAVMGFIGPVVLYRIRSDEALPAPAEKFSLKGSYDWPKIIRAVIPTLIIATGAGLTIPFISLFFYNVHHIGSDKFPFFGAIASLLVACAAFYVPEIKRRFSYRRAIPVTQSVAVIALIILATTEFYAGFKYAGWIALFCFVLRQPLMNIAGPMTSEVVMTYVGERNREMTSALTSAVWSGSWFISSWIFKVLRKEGLDYAYVFFITAALYALGVLWYYFLVKQYDSIIRQANPVDDK